MSNLFNIFAGVHGQEPMWLESSTTLAQAKERVDQLAAVFPGAYFVFNTSTGRVVYQTQAASAADRRFEEMKAARQEWERAAEGLNQALALFRDLNGSPAAPDGNLALRNARLRESWALKKYRAAVQAYTAAEIASRKGPAKR